MIYFMDLEGLLVCVCVAVVFSMISYLKGYEDGQRSK